MSKQLISLGVVIPTFIDSFEALSRLDFALDSVLKQELAPKQIVVSDDSPDFFSGRVKEICESKDSATLIFIRHLGAAGVSANSNNGLKLITTDFVHCLHQDDYIQHIDCYSRAASLLEGGEYSWVLLGGMASGLRITPKLRYGKIPLEVNLGLNSIGGPSAVIFPNIPSIRFSEDFTMLCDVNFFLHLQDTLGKPGMIDSCEIHYQMGEWQLQKRISDKDIHLELIKLNTQRKSELRDSLRLIFKYKDRRDVKLRGLMVMSSVSKKIRWRILAAIYKLYVESRLVVRRILDWR